MSNRDFPATQPLLGVKVIEFCNVAAGPYCGMLLADMGAEVTKVEPPTGDLLRQWPPLNSGFSENFASLNRNKRSITLDLKNPKERDIAEALVLRADIVLENNRPGVMKRLGLCYESFAEKHPELIYCSLSAFGQSGPRVAEGGFDVTLQALSGIMSVTGEPDGAPVKCGVPVADFAAGLYAAFAISASLAQVRAGGRGAHIDVPMLGVCLAISALQISEYFGTSRDPRRHGSAHPRNAPYQAFRGKDGDFVIAAGNNALWHRVCDVVRRTDLKDDPRFLENVDRARNQEVLRVILQEIFEKRTVEYWLGEFRNAGVPCGSINSYSEALADPQVRSAGWVLPLTLPSGHDTFTFASPLRFNGETPPIRSGPPALDEHREAIIAEIACAEDRTAAGDGSDVGRERDDGNS